MSQKKPFALFSLVLFLSFHVLEWKDVALAAEVDGDVHADVHADVHSEVAWALAYEAPAQPCTRPKQRKSNEAAGQFDRMQRKVARYAKCVKEYQDRLVQDHERIVQAAEFGITEQQAHVMVANIRNIEKILEEAAADYSFTPDGSEIERIYSIGNRSSI